MKIETRYIHYKQKLAKLIQEIEDKRAKSKKSSNSEIKRVRRVRRKFLSLISEHTEISDTKGLDEDAGPSPDHRASRTGARGGGQPWACGAHRGKLIQGLMLAEAVDCDQHVQGQL